MGLHLDTSKLLQSRYYNEAEEATFKRGKKKGFFADVAKALTVWLNSAPI